MGEEIKSILGNLDLENENMNQRRKITEEELKAVSAQLDEIYAPGLAKVYARLEAEAKAKAAKATPKEPFVKPEPKAKVAEKPEPQKVVEFPHKLAAQELARRQAAIDVVWERTQREKQELEREAAWNCHRGPGDSDWDLGA